MMTDRIKTSLFTQKEQKQKQENKQQKVTTNKH